MELCHEILFTGGEEHGEQEQIVEKFKEEYVPLVESERVGEAFLLLKQTNETVMEITKMFIKRALF